MGPADVPEGVSFRGGAGPGGPSCQVIVLDSSAAIEIALDTVVGKALRGLWCVDERVVSVPLFQSEVTNAFWKYVRAGVMLREEATRRLCVALSLVDEYADALDFAPEVLAESVRLGHPAYDVFYLVLARRCAGTLFSCDKKLVALCEENGVDCIHTESVPATVPRGLRATRG